MTQISIEQSLTAKPQLRVWRDFDSKLLQTPLHCYSSKWNQVVCAWPEALLDLHFRHSTQQMLLLKARTRFLRLTYRSDG